MEYFVIDLHAGEYVAPRMDISQINSDESVLEFSTITIEDGTEVDWGEI
ncbi:MAG: hypothetical protein J6X69_03275 [Bacteroidales bacterium]|nr:hypothetical protein [Bacteroidales bacterium]